MARTIGRLTALKVEKLREPGMHCDGAGLYLRITTEGTKNWVYRYRLNGRPHWMGLGSADLFGLGEARERAREARRLKYDGRDPIEARRAARVGERLATAKAVTFSHCAAKYMEAHRAGWRNAKHAAQWATTLEMYAYPILGALPVQCIDTGLVVQTLERIWREKPETASRLRGRIERVLDWATVRGFREAGPNPARWKGHLDMLLARAQLRRVEHHPAVSHAEVPTFMADLRNREEIGARALEFTILTAARSGEALGARWAEIDLVARVWTVPAARMKAAKEHRVPLSGRALALLEQLKPVNTEQVYVFHGKKPGKLLSHTAFMRVLRRMGRGDLTSHGFRSSFRDWAGEQTNFPREVAEAALAHVIGDETERAYRRGDALEKRRRLMDAWARFCAQGAPEGEVIPLRVVAE
jgi:integrase